MESQPCTTGVSPAMSNSVDIHAIDGRGVGTAISSIDIEKGGQQGSLTAAL